MLFYASGYRVVTSLPCESEAENEAEQQGGATSGDCAVMQGQAMTTCHVMRGRNADYIAEYTFKHIRTDQ